LYQAPTTLPESPSNLSASVDAGQAFLAWQCHSTNEDGFIVEQSTDGVNFGPIATTGRGVTSYTDTPAQPGTYYYRVKAFNLAGASDYTNSIQVDIPGAPPSPPGAVGTGKALETIGIDKPGMANAAALGYKAPVFSGTISVPGKSPPVAQAIATGSATSISMNGSSVKREGSATVPSSGFSSRGSLNALDELFALDMLELS
jgi:hypothetical protein